MTLRRRQPPIAAAIASLGFGGKLKHALPLRVGLVPRVGLGPQAGLVPRVGLVPQAGLGPYALLPYSIDERHVDNREALRLRNERNLGDAKYAAQTVVRDLHRSGRGCAS